MWFKTWMILACCIVAAACSSSDEPTKSRPKPERDAGAAGADASEPADASVANDASEPTDAAASDASEASERHDAQTIPASRADAALTVPEVCDSVAPTSCPDSHPRWDDVYPIFMNRCAGCHNGAGGEWPLNQYEHVADWYGEIRARMLDCTMPPVEAMIDMPVEERQTILQWIRCGFPK